MITLRDDRASKLAAGGPTVAGAAISRAGASVLLDRGGFLNAPSKGTVEALPLGGRAARVLVAHGSDPSWNL